MISEKKFKFITGFIRNISMDSTIVRRLLGKQKTLARPCRESGDGPYLDRS